VSRLDTLDRAHVTRCALSRICGTCARPLGRPIAFLGTAEEVGRNAFHAPPLHVGCAHVLLLERPDWELVTTSGFEFRRPSREDPDPLPTFQPNSLL